MAIKYWEFEDAPLKDKLKSVSAVLTKFPDMKVRVEGYTDNVGDSKANQKLSLLRARSVAKALSGMGVDKTRIAAVGKGKMNPIASNNTAAGRAKNRRVMFFIEK